TDGAGKGAHAVFGVIIGTGTGAGIVIGGRVLEGRHRIAGEWGHNALPWPEDSERPGPPCYCGRCGCIETFLSGPGLVRTYAAVQSSSLSTPPTPLAVPALIAERAAAGDAAANAALEIYEGRMARGLASVMNIVDPDIIVLGGGLSNIERLYTNVPARLGPYVFSDHAG